MATNYKGPLDYIDVATRIVEFREKYPEGSLQKVELQFLDFAGKSWVVYTAAAFRSPEDKLPGIGTAWEPVPGPTNFTRDSEVQNAETAAWGRAMVAALAVDTRKGVASSEEVRNRQVEVKASAPKPLPAQAKKQLTDAEIGYLEAQLTAVAAAKDLDALRAIYTTEKDLLDFAVKGTTLKDAINARVPELQTGETK